ncbi:MAG: Rieske (2Fe-2S) protein [Pseudohongiellaceae bacterium]
MSRQISVEPIEQESCLLIDTDGLNILLCNSGGVHYAIENRCTHQDSPLAGGRVRNGFIACPLHGVKFDLRTGEPRGDLARRAVQTFPVEVENNRITVTISE